ncbi:MAG: InlB B-repeat-containing protein [Candidatus Methanomethylophilaceae archaeon]|nr:InlB B-repeat-containing protein [Candidatus Methanomethylophilaceae archaeon]
MSDNLTLESTHIDANAVGHRWIGFKQSTITFDANGGTTSAEPTLTGWTGKLAELPTATRDGYSLQGWFTDAEGGTQVTTSTAFNSNRTIYAHWGTTPPTPVTTHTVTYDKNGGSAAAPTQDPVAEGATFTVKAYEGTKSGFEFGGWDLNGSTYQPGATITMGTSNITLKAIWNKVTSGVEGQVKWTVVGDKLIIQKNSDDGAMNDYTEDTRPAWESAEGWENVKTIEIADDVTKIGAHAFCKCTVISKVIIPATVTSIGDHAFDGIVFYKDGTEVDTTADNLKGKTYVGTGTDKKLYNLDAAGEMQITFNVDGGTSTSVLTVTLGQKLSSLPDAVREGYTFDGWYDASGKKITADYVFTADTTVTAKWIKEESKFEMTSGMIVALATVLTIIGVAAVAHFVVKKE